MIASMKRTMKSRLLTACLCAGGFLFPLAGASNNASAFEGDLKNDARLEGFKGRPVALDNSPAQYYLLFGGLVIVGLAVMFIDAKRSDVTK